MLITYDIEDFELHDELILPNVISEDSDFQLHTAVFRSHNFLV